MDVETGAPSSPLVSGAACRRRGRAEYDESAAGSKSDDDRDEPARRGVAGGSGDGPAAPAGTEYRLGTEEVLTAVSALREHARFVGTPENARIVRTAGRLVDAGVELADSPCLGVASAADGGAWACTILDITRGLAVCAVTLLGSTLATEIDAAAVTGSVAAATDAAEGAVAEAIVLAASVSTVTTAAVATEPAAAERLRARWAQLRTAIRCAEATATMCAGLGTMVSWPGF